MHGDMLLLGRYSRFMRPLRKHPEENLPLHTQKHLDQHPSCEPRTRLVVLLDPLDHHRLQKEGESTIVIRRHSSMIVLLQECSYIVLYIKKLHRVRPRKTVHDSMTTARGKMRRDDAR